MADKALLTKKLGRYDIIRVIGKGAMGVVYEGRDPNLDRRVAIKTIVTDSLSAEAAAEFEQRFRTEARSAARLQHPNIVSVYDADRDGDVQFIVMEYAQGEDLKHHLDMGQRYPLERSVAIVCDLLAALQYAHERKVIHRDIKPANLLVTGNGSAKLLDFGVARIQDSGEATRTQGAMVGTLKYMSPEQVEGKGVDASTDLFAAGIVLYQLLTDRRPFDGDSYSAIVQQIMHVNPEAPSRVNPMLPSTIDSVVATALAKDKGQRFASAADFATALRKAASNVDPTITPAANPHRAARKASEMGTASGLGSGVGSLGNTQSGSGNSAITQEIELVYWKDIKDSEDIQDIEGFLRRFPEGVYADLAKRRLKRIVDARAGQGSIPEYEKTAIQTLETPTDSGIIKPESVTVSEPTITRPFGVPKSLPGAGSEIAAAPYPAGSAATVATTFSTPSAIPSNSPGPKSGTAASPAPRQAPGAAKRHSSTDPSPGGASAAGRWIAVAAGLAAVVAVAAFFLSDSRAPDTSAGAPTPTLASLSTATAIITEPAETTTLAITTATASASATPALTSTLGMVTSTAARPTATASAPIAAASARVRAASQPATARRTDTTVISGDGAGPSSYPTAPAGSDKPAASKADNGNKHGDSPRPVTGGTPSQACEGRVMFGYLNCMRDQCAKPANRNHPDCDRWRKTEGNP